MPANLQICVRYEDLVADTESELRKCCDFLDVLFHPAMLQHERSGLDVGGLGSASAAKPITLAYLEEWRTAFTPTQIWCIERFSPAFVEFRYELTRPSVGPWSWLQLVALWLIHGLLSLVEVLVGRLRGRPFVWARLRHHWRTFSI